MDSEQGKAEVIHTEEGKSSSFSDGYEERKEGDNGQAIISDLKLDKKGLPLVPQPTDRKDDPLVCKHVAELSTQFTRLTIYLSSTELVTMAQDVHPVASQLACLPWPYGWRNRQSGFHSSQQTVQYHCGTGLL